MNIIKDLHNVYYCMWCHRTFDMLPADGKCPYCHQDRICLPGRYVVRNQHNVQIIKISSAGVINNMRTGSLWFQSPRIFHEYEGDGKKVRKDIHNSRYSRIDEKGYIVDKNVDTYRLLCFYTLNVDAEGNFLKKPNKRLKEFGNCYSIVDIKTLLAQLESYLITLNKKVDCFHDWVTYLRKNYSGAYSPFCKFPKDSYQDEFRIVLLSDAFLSLGKEPYKTSQSIGNLSAVFSEPQPLDNLLFGKNLEDI